MNYLTGDQTLASGQILWYVARALIDRSRVPYADLEYELRPTAVVTGADNALRAALNVGQHIGLLESDEGSWSLATNVHPPEHPRAFRAQVRRYMLGRAADDLAAGDEPADVVIGLAWLCTLDPADPLPWGWDSDKNSSGTEARVRDAAMAEVISNSAQWGAFRRWATYLGLARRSRPARHPLQMLIPDPADAISEELHQLDGESTAADFVSWLAERIPVVDGGRVWSHLEVLGIKSDVTLVSGIGPAVGHALLFLQAKGELELAVKDDASHRVSYRTGFRTATFDSLVPRGSDG